jgi:hypothetical protein
VAKTPIDVSPAQLRSATNVRCTLTASRPQRFRYMGVDGYRRGPVFGVLAAGWASRRVGGEGGTHPCGSDYNLTRALSVSTCFLRHRVSEVTMLKKRTRVAVWNLGEYRIN